VKLQIKTKPELFWCENGIFWKSDLFSTESTGFHTKVWCELNPCFTSSWVSGTLGAAQRGWYHQQLASRSPSTTYVHSHTLGGLQIPDGLNLNPKLVVRSCTSHPGVLGSIPKREDQVRDGQLVHTGLGSSSLMLLIAHVLLYPPPPTRTALY
jgi:hypothetical protein